MVFYVVMHMQYSYGWYVGSRPTYEEAVKLRSEHPQFTHCMIIEDEIGSDIPWRDRPFNSDDARAERYRKEQAALKEADRQRRIKIQEDNIARKFAEAAEKDRITQKYWPKAKPALPNWW